MGDDTQWWERLNARMSDLEMSAPQLADATGLHYSLVRKYLTGQVMNPRGKVLEKLGRAVGVSETFLRTGLDGPRDVRGSDEYTNVIIPELDMRAAAGAGSTDATESVKGTWSFPSEYAREMRIDRQEIMIAEIVGESMSPLLESGDRVVVNQLDVNPYNPGVFLLFDNGAFVAKIVEVVPQSDPVMLNLKSKNPDYSSYTVPADSVNVLGRISLRVSRV